MIYLCHFISDLLLLVSIIYVKIVIRMKTEVPTVGFDKP